MSTPGPARTEFASAALHITSIFAIRFKDTQVGEKAPRRVLVQEMDVETTGGGKQARVGVTLVPVSEKGAGGRPLVCGWIDAGAKRVQMRSYATVSAIFRTQNKRFFDLPEAEYQKFIEEARGFIEENNYRFDILDEVSPDQRPVSAARAPAPAPAAGDGNVLIYAMGAIIVLALIAAVVMLLT